MKAKKIKSKKSIKHNRSESARQVAARRRIGCPGVSMFKMKDLEPAGYNPREIDAEALEGLTNSISRFGCVEPIIVNTRGRHNVIVGGHQRYRALKRLRIKEVICVTVDCSKEDEKLLNLTLNNPHIQGEFIEGIAGYIDKLRAGLSDKSAYLDLRIAELRGEIADEKQGLIPDDEVPKPPKKAITKPGDLWILGRHRLLCGDSTKEADVKRLMGRKKASLFATDPPYFVDLTHKRRPTKKKQQKKWVNIYREIDENNARQFIKEFYSIGKKFIQKNTALYLWHADKHRTLIEEACLELKINAHQEIIWVKPCVVISYSYFLSRHEPCMLMWIKGEKPKVPNNYFGIPKDTIWVIGYSKDGDPTMPEYYNDVWELDYDGKKRPAGIEHPTVKPVEVFAIPMRVHTKPGDICYEPFCGSGTQIIAAEKLNRKCFAIEKEPIFVDVSVKRWERWTGKKAKLERK